MGIENTLDSCCPSARQILSNLLSKMSFDDIFVTTVFSILSVWLVLTILDIVFIYKKNKRNRRTNNDD